MIAKQILRSGYLYPLWIGGIGMSALSTCNSLFSGPSPFGAAIGIFTLWLLLGIAAWLLALLILAFLFLAQRKWQRAASCFIALTLTIPVVRLGGLSGDYIHLALLYPHYRAVISNNPGQQTRFPWGEIPRMLAIDPNENRTLIYDPNGSLEKFVGVTRFDLSDGAFPIYTHHLIGNFFIEILSKP